MKTVLDYIVENKIRLHLINKGDEFCEANGEDIYVNTSYSDGHKIWLGIFDNKELRNLSLIHEIAHCLIDDEKFESIYELEKVVWAKTYEICDECEMTFSKEAKSWAKKQLNTYKHYK